MRQVLRWVGVVALVLCGGCGRSMLAEAEEVAADDGGAGTGAARHDADVHADTHEDIHEDTHEDTQADAADEARPNEPLQLFVVTPPPARVGEAYLHPFRVRGGTPPYSWRVIAGVPPEGLGLLGLDGASTQLGGKPVHSGTHFFSVAVTDSASASASYGLKLVVRGRIWALYRGDGLHAVDLTTPEGGAPVALGPGWHAHQPGGSVDLLSTGTDGSVFGVDLGGLVPSNPVPLGGVPSNPKGPKVVSPAWSKDGTRLAYLLGSDDKKDLCVVDVAVGDTIDPTAKPAVPRRISAGTDWSFIWAGASLVYSTVSGTFKVPLDPAGPPEPFSVWVAKMLSVAPDDTRLVYTVDVLDAAGSVQETNQYLLGLNGHPPAAPLKLDSEAIRANGFTGFGWTRDSKSLIYWGRPATGSNQEFLQLGVDGTTPGAPQVLTEAPCPVQEARSSHDLRWLAFNACGLWLADLGGGTPATPRRLVPDPGPDGGLISRLTWSADDARLLFMSNGELNAVDVAGGATGAPANLYAGLPAGYKKWALAPDGSKVAVRVVKGPRQEIYLVSLASQASQAPVKISAEAPDGFYQYTPDRAGAWSPDGSRFVYEVLAGKDFQVFAVNLDGVVPSNARRISTDEQPGACCEEQFFVER